MNLNEKCLLKYLTNPIGSFNKVEEGLSNVLKTKDFSLADFKNDTGKIIVNRR